METETETETGVKRKRKRRKKMGMRTEGVFAQQPLRLPQPRQPVFLCSSVDDDDVVAVCDDV